MLLNDFIYEDLRARIQSGKDTPATLTLSALSQRYQVSLTPIRMAVERLVLERYLLRLSNGRVEVSRRLPRPRRKSCAAPSPPVNHEATLQRDVIRLSLQGKSDYIREEAIAARYGVGRTAIRPILSRLAGKGLLEYVPRCGWRPRTFDNKDLHDFLRVREALELKALDQAKSKLDSEVLRQLLDENRKRTRMATGALANSLHGYWIGLTDNRYIQDFFERHGVYYGTLFDFATPSAEAIDEMAGQHCQILEALLDKRWREARRALAEHIRAQKPIVQKLVTSLRGAED